MPPPPALLALPAELLAAILACLEPHALLAAAAASRLLARIVAASSRLQYTISLAKHRLLDIHPAALHPPYATRLRLLTDREQAWSDLRWKARHTLKLPPTGSVYEFVGGIYGNGREDDNRVTASISFLELPTSASVHSDPSRPLRTWTHAMGDVTIIDFTMDPSQDLLVLVAVAPLDSKYIYNLHLRTISTNDPHPRAPLPILSCLDRHPSNPPHHELFAAVRVQVSGDLVGLLIKEAPDPIGAHLQIWNWENDPHYPCSMSSQQGIDDFTFLSRSAFLTVLPAGKFVVYSFPDPLGSPAPHSSLPRAGCKPVEKYAYEFPELTNGYMYWYISMSCNPAPGYVPCQGDRAMDPFPEYAGTLPPHNADGTNPNHPFNDPTKQQLYYPLPDERIHACCIYIFNPNQHPHNFAVHNNTANGNPTISHNVPSTTAGGTAQHAPAHLDFFMDEELQEENQQVHSFVFFMNLKNLLDPPDEWIHRQDKKQTTTPTANSNSIYLSNNDSTSVMSLESSLNALKRRQEEKELHDAVSCQPNGGGSEKGKKRKAASSSSSLSVEIPLGESSTRSNSMVTRSKSLLSTMMATAMRATSPTRPTSSTSFMYPPFPTFSSPPATTSNVNGSKRGSLSRDTDNRGDTSRASSLEEVEDIIMATSESPPATGPLRSGSLSRPNTIITPHPNAVSSASSSSSTSSASTSVSHTNITNTMTSSSKTRSASTPPTYTPHNHNDHHDYSNLSSSRWPNNSQHHQPHQDMRYPGGFNPSASSSLASSSSSSTQIFPSALNHSSTLFTNPSSSQNDTANLQQQQQQKQQKQKQKQANNSTGSTSSTTSFTSSPSASAAAGMVVSSPSSPSPAHDDKDKSKKKPICVPWEVWGPSSTRWFEECLSTDWQHAIYGLRTVESVSEREREGMKRRLMKGKNRVSGAAYSGEGKQKEKDEVLRNGKRGVFDGKGKRKAKEGEEDGSGDDGDDGEGEGVVGKRKKGDGDGNETFVIEEDILGRGQDDDDDDEILILQRDQERKIDNNDRSKGKGAIVVGGGGTPDLGLDHEDAAGRSETNHLAVSHVSSSSSSSSLLSSSSLSSSTQTSSDGDGTYMMDAVQTTTTGTGAGAVVVAGTSASASASSSSLTGLPVIRRPRRFLRVRDFNPYSLRQAELEAEVELAKKRAEEEAKMGMGSGVNGDFSSSSKMVGKGKGKEREVLYSQPLTPALGMDRMAKLPSRTNRLPHQHHQHHSYSYPFPIQLNVNSNFSNSLVWNNSNSALGGSLNSSSRVSMGAGSSSSSSPSLSSLSSAAAKKTTASSTRATTKTDLIWGKRRVVREPSVTPVKGVFKKDVVSWLPYTEVVSEETFEVTDVMMDDCRLLLLKRGQMGKLESVEVLMM